MKHSGTDIPLDIPQFGLRPAPQDTLQVRPRPVNAYELGLVRDYNPLGVTENLVITTLARLAAMGDQLDAARAALAEQASRGWADVATTSVAGNNAAAENLASALVSEGSETLSRQILGNAKAIFRGVGELRDMDAKRREVAALEGVGRDPNFMTETHCYAHLFRRFRDGDAVCHRCGSAGGGFWIASRRASQCAACHAQTCVREGTVAAQSHLPVANWFHAIRLLLLWPRMSTADLARHTGVNRAATARRMRNKICAAMQHENATDLLAGLDDLYFPCG